MPKVNALYFIFFILLFIDNGILQAAEKPLGLVTDLKGEEIKVEFDSSVYLLAGTMVAVYGGGTIKKHPLTDKVVVRELEEVAKGQIVGAGGNLLRVQLTWKKSGVVLKPGMDVIPLSGENAPNAPPIQTGEIKGVSAPLQSSVRIRFPIQDPDGDEVSYSWELSGKSGEMGFLEARITRAPENLWFVPGVQTEVKMTITATDSYGQGLSSSTTLKAEELKSTWRSRKLQPFCSFGGKKSPFPSYVNRDQEGRWWGVTENSIFTFSPGGLEHRKFPLQGIDGRFNPVAIVPVENGFHLLDSNSPTVRVFDLDGELQRTYGIISQATDMVINSDGVVFIADQTLGGVLVYEPDGIFRACFGRSGEGPNDFSGLTRLALDPEGKLYALDSNTAIIHRFDRFQRRLPSWPLEIGGAFQAIDLSWHPSGELLVLLADGRIVRLTDKGTLGKNVLSPESKQNYIGILDSPDSFYVDKSGEVFVVYSKNRVIFRYSTDGLLYGLRGAPLQELTLFYH